MKIHVARYPFVRTQVELFDDEGTHIAETWRPGVEWDDDPHGECSPYAEALGRIELTEISRHKPGKYPERVFYVRQWIDPDGNRFGKTALQICTAEKFSRLCKGYGHDFILSADDDSKDVDVPACSGALPDECR